MIFEKNSSDIFDGIFRYLRQNNSDEIYQKLIQTNASSVLTGYASPNVVFDPFVTGNLHTDNWASSSIDKSNITVSFFDHYVSVSEYSIRSRTDHDNNYPLEWVFEGTNDFIHWSTIHYHERNGDISGLGLSKSYHTSDTSFFHSFRFTQIGLDSSSQNSFFVVNKIEFFGKLIMKHQLFSFSLFHCELGNYLFKQMALYLFFNQILSQ